MCFIWKKVPWDQTFHPCFSGIVGCVIPRHIFDKAPAWGLNNVRQGKRKECLTGLRFVTKLIYIFAGHDGCFCWCSLYTWKHWWIIRDIFWPTLANIWCIMALKMRIVAVYRPVLVIGFEVDIQCFFPESGVKTYLLMLHGSTLGVLDFFHSGWMKR